MSRSDSKSAASHRLERVAETVRHALAEVFARGDVQDPVLQSHAMTVVWVKMSPDIKLATIAVMPLGGKDAAKTLAALEANKKMLRALIAHRVNLKYAPDLRFVLDESFDMQARIDALLSAPEVARDLKPAKSEDGE